MKLELVTDFEHFSDLTGINPLSDLIYPPICMDSCKNVVPFLVESPPKFWLFTRCVEKQCVEQKCNNPDVEIIFYQPYFMMDERLTISGAFNNLREAVLAKLPGDNQIAISDDAPLGLVRELSSICQTEIVLKGESPSVFLYEVSKEAVSSILRNAEEPEGYEAVCAAVNELLRSASYASELRQYFGVRTDDPFKMLEKLTSGSGMDGICVYSPIDVQELSGIGLFRLPEGTLGLVIGNQVYLISLAPIDAPQLREVKRHVPRKTVLYELCKGAKIGASVDMPVGIACELSADVLALKSATPLLREWKEMRAINDLAFYVIAARASRYSTEGSLEFASSTLKESREVTEADVFRRRLLLGQEFLERYGLNKLGVSLRPYFVNLHATSRTMYPSVPTPNPIVPETKCVRFDSGFLVLDERGILRACSDIGRSLVLGQEGQELYSILERGISEVAIPSINPGKSGKEVYRVLINFLSKHEAKIKGLGLMHEHTVLGDVYRRDVGHLLGKQEPTSFHIDATQEAKFVEGMIGSVEFPWMFGEYALGYEDMFFVTARGGIDITRD